jgi:pimeloyl-ACP methyl ester carboxylesterase
MLVRGALPRRRPAVCCEVDEITIAQFDRAVSEIDARAANRAPPDVAKRLGNYPELGRAVARRIPQATLVEFADLGHSPQISAPDRFHEALLKGLAP